MYYFANESPKSVDKERWYVSLADRYVCVYVRDGRKFCVDRLKPSSQTRNRQRNLRRREEGPGWTWTSWRGSLHAAVL